MLAGCNGGVEVVDLAQPVALELEVKPVMEDNGAGLFTRMLGHNISKSRGSYAIMLRLEALHAQIEGN